MTFALPAADRLVRAVADRRALRAEEAARTLFALAGGPRALAFALLDRVVAEDARLVRHGDEIRLAAAPWAEAPLGAARFAVVDLETTGLVAGPASITEAAVVLLCGCEPAGELELLVGPGRPPREAVAELLRHAGDAVLVGHNLPFDLAFLDRELAPEGLRLAASVIDTLPLARRLLGGRGEGLSLACLAERFGTSRPEHRALADARAAAEVFGRLLALARDAGARTVGDVAALARTGSEEGRRRR